MTMVPQIRSLAPRYVPMPNRRIPPTNGDRPTVDDVMAEKRRRLVVALHRLARELAEARWRNRQLQRELERLRAERPPRGAPR
jgi:hypothetical protein